MKVWEERDGALRESLSGERELVGAYDRRGDVK